MLDVKVYYLIQDTNYEKFTNRVNDLLDCRMSSGEPDWVPLGSANYFNGVYTQTFLAYSYYIKTMMLKDNPYE